MTRSTKPVTLSTRMGRSRGTIETAAAIAKDEKDSRDAKIAALRKLRLAREASDSTTPDATAP